LLVLLNGEKEIEDTVTKYSVDIPNNVVNEHVGEPIALFIDVGEDLTTLSVEFDDSIIEGEATDVEESE
jgi:hypothetical protein